MRSNCTQYQSCRAFQGLSIGIKIIKIRTKTIHLNRVKDDPFASTGTKDWNHVFPRKIKCSGFLTKLEERGGDVVHLSVITPRGPTHAATRRGEKLDYLPGPGSVGHNFSVPKLFLLFGPSWGHRIFGRRGKHKRSWKFFLKHKIVVWGSSAGENIVINIVDQRTFH